MKILVIGGNSYFGKTLVKSLLGSSHEVTLLNRANVDDGFGEKVERIKCDRRDDDSLKRAVGSRKWDLVYDQVCFDFHEASAAINIFKDRVDRYVMTSSQSVYNQGGNLKESDFDPHKYQLKSFKSMQEDYAEAKRQAEWAFFTNAPFPVVAVRLPIVIGSNDPTQRVQMHVKRVMQNQPIYFPNLEAKISFIFRDHAAEVLEFLSTSTFRGPLNVASPEAVSLEEFLTYVQTELAKNAILAETRSEEAHSPYGIEDDWYMNCETLAGLGIRLPEVKEWLPGVIKRVAKSVVPGQSLAQI